MEATWILSIEAEKNESDKCSHSFMIKNKRPKQNRQKEIPQYKMLNCERTTINIIFKTIILKHFPLCLILTKILTFTFLFKIELEIQDKVISEEGRNVSPFKSDILQYVKNSDGSF